MPLTRNLYREDEVLASLKFCVLKGKGQEAIFWAQEALDSEMGAQVLEALFWVWLFGAASAQPDWLREFRRTLQSGQPTSDEVIYLTMMLARDKKKGTEVLALLGLGLHQRLWADRVGQPELPTFSRVLSEVELAAARAIRQGKLAYAWGLLRPLWSKDEHGPWQLLKEIAKDPDTIGLLEAATTWFAPAARYIWPIRAAAIVLSATASRQTETGPWEPPIEWSAYRYDFIDLPMRFRRIHVPPVAALFWMTERGSLAVSQTTQAELMSGLEIAMEGSTFWSKRVPELSASHDSREAFYERYFPTDIPDEWSAAERLVSHGIGTLSDPATADIPLKFATTLQGWFGAAPCSIWQGATEGLKALVDPMMELGTRLRPAALEVAVAVAYERLGSESWPSEAVLEPVKRKLVVA